jgi:hypothetical protein
MSYAFNRIVMDYVKFDEWLEEQYPDEWKTSSMEDILLSHYGKEGAALIKRLL